MRAGIATLNGNGPNANPVVIVGIGSAGYTALRMALNDPLGIVGVITMYTPIEAPGNPTPIRGPDLITLLARLNVPVQFHAGTDDPAITREQLNWLGRFVAVEPDRRELYLYGGAGYGFYQPSAEQLRQGLSDAGAEALARIPRQALQLDPVSRYGCTTTWPCFMTNTGFSVARDVVQHVALHGDDVGELAGFERADFGVDAEQLGRPRACRRSTPPPAACRSPPVSANSSAFMPCGDTPASVPNAIGTPIFNAERNISLVLRVSVARALAAIAGGYLSASCSTQ